MCSICFSLYSVLRGKKLGFSSWCKHVDSSNTDGDLTTKHMVQWYSVRIKPLKQSLNVSFNLKGCTGSIFGVFILIWTQFQLKIFKARRGCSWSPAPVNDLICFGGSLVVPWWFLGGLKSLLSGFTSYFPSLRPCRSSTTGRMAQLINNLPSLQPRWCGLLEFSTGTHMNQQAEPIHNMEKTWKTITILTPGSVISLPFCRIKVHHLCWKFMSSWYLPHVRSLFLAIFQEFKTWFPHFPTTIWSAARCGPRAAQEAVTSSTTAGQSSSRWASPMSRTGRPSWRISTVPWRLGVGTGVGLWKTSQVAFQIWVSCDYCDMKTMGKWH